MNRGGECSLNRRILNDRFAFSTHIKEYHQKLLPAVQSRTRNIVRLMPGCYTKTLPVKRPGPPEGENCTLLKDFNKGGILSLFRRAGEEKRFLLLWEA